MSRDYRMPPQAEAPVMVVDAAAWAGVQAERDALRVALAAVLAGLAGCPRTTRDWVCMLADTATPAEQHELTPVEWRLFVALQAARAQLDAPAPEA